MVVVALLAIAISAIYVGSRLRDRADRPEVLVIWITVAGGLIAVAVLSMIHTSPYSSGSTEVAWRAVGTQTANQPLQVGGPGDSATVGWPSGTFAPRLNVQLLGPRRVRVTVSEGHAFLSNDERVVNGVELAPAGGSFGISACSPFNRQPQTTGDTGTRIGQFGIRIAPRCLEPLVDLLWRSNRFSPPTLEIVNSSGILIAQVRASSGDRNRVVALEGLVLRETARLREQGQAKLAGELENWAASVWLFIPTSGRLRTLDRQAEYHVELDLPSRLRLQWPGLSLVMEVDADTSGRLTAVFLPPWRRASPLPPAGVNGTSLDVTARAQPGDFAFLIPFGSSLSQFRERVQLDNGRFASVSQPPPSLSPFAPAGVNGDTVSGSAVTSQTTISAGGLNFLIATVEDLPQLLRLDFAVLLALILLGAGSAIGCHGLQREDAWTVASVTLCVWTLLSIRLLLAYRYAQEPSYIDALSVSGFAYALFGLATIPSLVLLPARLWRDRHTDFNDVADQHTAGRRVFRLVLAVTVAGALEWWLGYSLWLNAPRSGRTILLFLASLGVVWLAVSYFIVRQYWLNDEGGGNWSTIDSADNLGRSMASDLPTTPRSRASLVPRMTRFARSLRHGALARLILAGIWRGVAFVRHAIRPEWLAKEFGPRFWSDVGTVADASDVSEPDLPASWWGLMRRALNVFVSVSILLGILFAITRLPIPGVKEIIVPLLVVWGPAVIWLSSRRRFASGTSVDHFHWPYAVVLGFFLLFVPAFLTPLLMRDAGGLIASVAVYCPLVALLWAGGKPRHLAYAATGLLVSAFVLASVFYLNLSQILPSSYSRLAGQAGVRLLIFKRQVDAERAIPWTPVATSEGRSAFTVNELRQGLEHTWENRAIANRGGWTGLGFGQAPVRQSQVRQDTLQYDSTFSFFILSEHGLVGGLALLCIYVLPVLLIFASGRRLFDIGHAFALLVFSAFFLEAAAQAGMNLGVIPFTGRNLPLLAVNSMTADLVKWAILLGLGIQAIVWRAGGERRVFVDNVSLLASRDDTRDTRPRLRRMALGRGALLALPAAGLLVAAYAGIVVIYDNNLRNPFSWQGLLDEVRALANSGRLRFNPVTQELEPSLAQSDSLIEQERLRFNALEAEEKIEGRIGIGDLSNQLARVRSVREYDDLMASLRDRAERPTASHRPLLFRVEPARMWADEAATIPTFEPEWAVRANPEYNARVSFAEAARPENLPRVQLRAAAATSSVVSGRGFQFELPGRLPRAGESRDVVLAAQGDGSLTIVRDSNPQGARARVLLQFRPQNERGNRTVLLGELESSDSSVSFRRGELRMRYTEAASNRNNALIPGQEVQLHAADRVETLDPLGPGLRPGFEIQSRASSAQIGPAWVMGSWRTAAAHDPNYPWLPLLAQALPEEWNRLGRNAAAQLYGELTLEPALHAATQRFAARHGRALHEVLLPARSRDEALPPRIAIAVLSLPAGEALALGSWPRMASGSTWESGSNGELLPPGLWLTTQAPRSLERRYYGDRNFDRMILGSATKPLIASAALAVHPGLDRQLAVRGAAGPEEAVFGIPIRPEWTVGSSHALDGGDWADFTSYLVRSDNRYQVRLGFLGLAEHDGAEGGRVAAELPASPSTTESLNGGRQPWNRYPRFPADIEFSHRSPDLMRNLHLTPFANQLERMFGVGRTVGSRDFRISFWTGNESDDVRTTPSAEGPPGPSSLLRAISPEAPDLGLDAIRTPRNFLTLLLGGGSNLWANADFAAAFATVISGVPLIAHVTRGATVNPVADREPFQQIAERIRPGLQGVVENAQGTANAWFARSGALIALRELGPNVRLYAKTGTLEAARGLPDNSRLALAVVEWRPDGLIARGLVFSIVVERGEQGKSTELLATFIAENIADIRNAWQQLPAR